MVEHERLAVAEHVALSPVFACFAELWELSFVELIGVRLTVRDAASAPTDFLKEPHCY